jgi:hypothetical protein
MKRSGWMVLVLLVLVMGCALESKYALPKSETIDPELLGTWAFTSDDGTEELLHVEALDAMTYKITLEDEVITAHSATINGHRIMNLVSADEGYETPNMFYGFVLKKNKLKIMEVTDQWNDDDFGSQAELIRFFEDHIDRPEFFINPDELKRQKNGNSYF